ncbi:sulfotransferase 1E1 [Patella vulgata]|uniref:sulfotransferase 1E1 n=1 Tax=Patella vulgata TaxID=6465 RepID=UPI0021802E61|nr:sulfotransferase 1E1 [Patella vulgata]
MENVGNNEYGTIKEIVIKDKSGNDFKMIEVDGVYLLPVGEELVGNKPEVHFRQIKDFKIRDDDVMICAYPKAGTHWIWEVIQMLRSQSTEYNKQIKEKQMLEFGMLAEIDQEPSPRLLNSHLWPRHLPTEMFSKKTKIIYLLRNPKDTIVSYFFHISATDVTVKYYGTIRDFIDMSLYKTLPYGTWYDYVLEWEKFFETTENPFYQFSYEDMHENPAEHVNGLAKFLDLRASDELCKAIVEACSFKKLKKANEEIKDNFLKYEWKEGVSIYREGKVGDWKNWLTVAESESFDKVTEEKLKNSKVKVRYTL